MTESKEVTSSNVDETSLVTVAGDGPEGDDTTVVAESSTKSKKNKKNKLKNLFSKQPLEASALAQIEKAIGSTTLEDDHSMSKGDQKNLDTAIDKMNQVLPGGKKGLSDHKFWKTQPVVNFGILPHDGINFQMRPFTRKAESRHLSLISSQESPSK
jgi:uncharacterized protein YdaL